MRPFSLILASKILLVVFSTFAKAQNIPLRNASFEENAYSMPEEWISGNKSFSKKIAFIQPNEKTEVSKTAFDGNSYVALVVRETGYKEALAQKLSQPIRGGSAYEFSIELCMSERYVSPLPSSQEGPSPKSYINPVFFKIYGSDNPLNRDELLAVIGPVNNFNWQNYTVILESSRNHNWLVLEADFDNWNPYNGHVLLDNASDLIEILDPEPENSLRINHSIKLSNPSFEGIPHCCMTPVGWRDCGPPSQTPPDIQPSGQFGVTAPAFNGSSYLGMVVRETGTTEAIGQKLSSPLRIGETYQFKLWASLSEVYESMVGPSTGFGSPTSEGMHRASFVHPVVLKIYGGNDYCSREELLGVIGPVDHFYWDVYEVFLKPSNHYTHLILQADFNGYPPYNGHILIDNASDLVPVKGKN
ncbi:MAG: hypothetical protein H6561_00100 [Lewinellaceae bacterium]|nr:hypothetical protein [Lewinellaceae bacterium]